MGWLGACSPLVAILQEVLKETYSKVAEGQVCHVLPSLSRQVQGHSQNQRLGILSQNLLKLIIVILCSFSIMEAQRALECKTAEVLTTLECKIMEAQAVMGFRIMEVLAM